MRDCLLSGTILSPNEDRFRAALRPLSWRRTCSQEMVRFAALPWPGTLAANLRAKWQRMLKTPRVAGCRSTEERNAGSSECFALASNQLLPACGGRGGIRTLEAVITPTRFPVARTRPNYATLPAGAERVGFEPTEALHLTAFRERHLQPLGHLSAGKYTNQAVSITRRQKTARETRAELLVRLAGIEPAAFGSATQRSIR